MNTIRTTCNKCAEPGHISSGCQDKCQCNGPMSATRTFKDVGGVFGSLNGRTVFDNSTSCKSLLEFNPGEWQVDVTLTRRAEPVKPFIPGYYKRVKGGSVVYFPVEPSWIDAFRKEYTHVIVTEVKDD